jgi:hypothetical protein
MKGTLRRRRMHVAGLTLALALAQSVVARADEVLDWNAILMRAVRTAGTPPPINLRLMAIVHTAMFDALNGIERRFTPIHVGETAPPGASRRAAVVQAAYTALVGIYPAQSAALTQELEASLAAIASESAVEHSESIERGRAWGAHVAEAILAWRSTDGFDPSPSTYQGSLEIGKWRPAPPAFANGLAPSLATTLPFVIPTASSFRPAGPPSLTSLEYAEAFNEVKAIGSATSTVRTPEQTTIARFWGVTAPTFWNRAAVSAALQRNTTLSENARLFALLNAAMADAGISCWDAKYFFEFWRPIHAIRLASLDGNPLTEEQADWTSLLATPPYPEYSSGHATISGAAQRVLTIYFGSDMPLSGWSEAFGDAYVRSWPNFEAAADEAYDSRIYAGIHFQFAMRDAREKGIAIGDYVMANAARPSHGRRAGQLR